MATTLLVLLMFIGSPLHAGDEATDAGTDRVTTLAQADQVADQATGEEVLEEVVVVGTQIKGAAISEALAVTSIDAQEIEASGISSAQELLDYLPEQGQNFQTEAANAYNYNAVRGDVGAFNLRNMGTGNTLVLLNGRRLVQTAGYQTERVGGSLVPVNSVNPNALPTTGIRRVEVLRDGASAIYGADAVAGVVNTVLQNNFEGLTVRARYDWYDNIPANNYRGTVKWGHDFNEGRTNVSLFADYYHRDRVNSQDDKRWATADFRLRLDEDSIWLFDPETGRTSITTFRNTYVDSGFGQFDMSGSVPGLTDSSGEFETYPWDHAMCQDSRAWYINEQMCGIRDGLNRDPISGGIASGPYYDPNAAPFGRDLRSDLDRYNVFLFINHEFENGVEAYTELSYYQADTTWVNYPATTLGGFEMVMGKENYYNPFGPCGSPNRLPDWLIPDFTCAGKDLVIDYYRWVEYPRIGDNTAKSWRFLQGFRGSWGDWDWDTALVWSEAKRTDITHNRLSNTLMWEALHDPTPAAYNPFASGFPGYPNGSNIERALIDMYRKNETDLKMVDFKISNPELFNMPAGPVGFLMGAEYREESFLDDRDPRIDGTITYTHRDGQTYPYVSDVINSSPSSDSWGDRDTFSAFVEFALPLFDNFDVQAALRYEDASDYGSTTVGKLAFGWRVFEPLLIRGSWSEAYRAPNLITVFEGLVVRANTRTSYVCRYAEEMWDVGRSPDDPRYEEARNELDCSDSVQRRASGSEFLEPETSTNTSIGLVWEPTENLMFTVDFWSIEKKDTIGLFGENNHSLLDTLLHIENGLSNCASFVGNPVMGYSDPDPDQVEYYTYAGICPIGQYEYVNDWYANLDTRIVEGHDIGIFYSYDGNSGSWDLSIRGAFYDKYIQKAGPASQALIDAAESGIFPEGFPVPTGFGNLLRVEGNQTTKYNASLRWRRDAVGAGLSAYYLSDFVDNGPGVRQGQKYVIPSMTTYNGYVDYFADLFGTDTRFRFGVNNLLDERAPLSDDYYGFFPDAHRDYGRYYYVDIRMDF
jgi:outer membrane receptor protein involved in Fe transport